MSTRILHWPVTRFQSPDLNQMHPNSIPNLLPDSHITRVARPSPQTLESLWTPLQTIWSECTQYKPIREPHINITLQHWTNTFGRILIIQANIEQKWLPRKHMSWDHEIDANIQYASTTKTLSIQYSVVLLHDHLLATDYSYSYGKCNPTKWADINHSDLLCQ